jgi:nicotinate-nucleotide pyrophosphorylase (carboxylating)
MTTASNSRLDVDSPGIRDLVRLSLDEDVGEGDITSRATIASGTTASSRMIVRESCIVAGMVLLPPLIEGLAARPGYEAAADLRVSLEASDGDRVEAGAVLCRIDGDARAILTLERSLLNFVGRLSGIATETARFVAAVGETGATTRILDTRKTTPGHRVLEKYAVRCGGGSNHRFGLFDAVLIKDNHIAAAGGVGRPSSARSTMRRTVVESKWNATRWSKPKRRLPPVRISCCWTISPWRTPPMPYVGSRDARTSKSPVA